MTEPRSGDWSMTRRELLDNITRLAFCIKIIFQWLQPVYLCSENGKTWLIGILQQCLYWNNINWLVSVDLVEKKNQVI